MKCIYCKEKMTGHYSFDCDNHLGKVTFFSSDTSSDQFETIYLFTEKNKTRNQEPEGGFVLITYTKDNVSKLFDISDYSWLLDVDMMLSVNPDNIKDYIYRLLKLRAFS
jgi:hypothetical protein